MLSLFALFFYKSKSPEIALLLSSLAAANSIEDFGNDRVVEKNVATTKKPVVKAKTPTKKTL